MVFSVLFLKLLHIDSILNFHWFLLRINTKSRFLVFYFKFNQQNKSFNKNKITKKRQFQEFFVLTYLLWRHTQRQSPCRGSCKNRKKFHPIEQVHDFRKPETQLRSKNTNPSWLCHILTYHRSLEDLLWCWLYLLILT